MGRKWTEEEKKAFGAKMKALREEKAKQTVEQIKETGEAPKPTVEIPAEQLSELMARLDKLEAEKKQSYQPTQAQISPTGQIMGIQERYPISKALYVHLNPIQRLLNEPAWKRFALEDNYHLLWDVFTTTYTTSTGVKMSEPRFELEIRQKQMDEDGNVIGEYQIGKHVRHEDYDAAVELALSLGMEVDPNMGVEFLDEMRYQDWKMFINEIFFPPKAISQSNNGKKEIVVGGKVVTFYENPKQLNKDISGV